MWGEPQMVRPSPEAAIFIMIAIETTRTAKAQQGQPSSAAAEFWAGPRARDDASRTPEGTGYWKVRVHRHQAPLLFPSKSGYMRSPPLNRYIYSHRSCLSVCLIFQTCNISMFRIT